MQSLGKTFDRETGETLDITSPDWPRTGTLIDFLEKRSEARLPQEAEAQAGQPEVPLTDVSRPGPGAASPAEFGERFARKRVVPPDVTPPPAAPPEARAALPDEQSIHHAVARKDVLPGRDWIASPEFEFRNDPIAAPLVTRVVEADLSWRSKVGQAEERVAGQWRQLSKPQQIKVSEALREDMAGRPEKVNALEGEEYKAASEMRVMFEGARLAIQKSKRDNLMESLPASRAAALQDILNGVPEAEAFKTHKLRAAGQAAVRAARDELEAIDRWGIEDYVTNIERGSYRVIRYEIVGDAIQERTVAVGETRSAAAAKAKAYLDAHPDVTDLTISNEWSPNVEMPTLVSQAQFHRLVNKIKRATGEDAKEIQAMLRREGRIVSVKPAPKFAGALQRRYDILKGEENLLDVVPLYLSSIYKKLELDPVLKQARNELGKLASVTRTQVESLLQDVRGRYALADQVVDHLLSPLGGKPFAFSRGVNVARSVVAPLKLGFRPVAAAINRFGGLAHTWIKTSVQAIREGRRSLKTPEFQELWRRVGPLVGADPAAFLEGFRSRHAPKWYSPSNLPLAMFQYAEKVNRPEAFASHLWWAKNKLGLEGEAAVQHAMQATRFGQFIYSIGSLPRALRTPSGRLLGQFKAYFVKELEFMAMLSAKEWPKYIAAFAVMGGPRAWVYFLRSVPILGALGLLREADDWLNRNAPVASRGVGGALGVDITAAATPQMPDDVNDWLGPAVSDAHRLWTDVLRPVVQGESKDFSDVGQWATRLAPAVMYWSRMLDAIDDNWVRDARGRPVYEATDADKIKMLLGAKPLRQAVEDADRRYLYEVDQIARKRRQDVLDRLAQGKFDDDTLEAMREYGITLDDAKAAAKRNATPVSQRAWRNLLRSTRAKRLAEEAE